MLSRIPEEKLEEFKSEIGTDVLIGEYVGGPNQHMVRYDEEDVLWVCSVDENGGLKFWDEFFAKWGFKQVSKERFSTVNTWEELEVLLKKIEKSVVESPISLEEEGSVLYFVQNERILSLAKLKTFEYRCYRKLRKYCEWCLSKVSH